MADLNIGNSSASVVVNAKHNGSVIPQIDNTYDLGTSELRWKNIYASQVSDWYEISKNGTGEGTIVWNRILLLTTRQGDEAENDSAIEFELNGDQNYAYARHGYLFINSYGATSRNLVLTSSGNRCNVYATLVPASATASGNTYVWLGLGGSFTGKARMRILYNGSKNIVYTSSADRSITSTAPNTKYITNNGNLKAGFNSTNSTWSYILGVNSANGNAVTATKLATVRTISLTGSVTGSGTFDGSSNLSIATTTNHTHNYAGSSSAGGPANSVKTNLIIKLNSGTTEGTNLFTFNGSTAKTINITPSAIGASASGHTHAAATTSANGFMSSSDKSKLDSIATGANKYTHPTYTSKSSGFYKVTVDGTGHVSAATAVTKEDIIALGIPGSDTNTWRGIQNNLISTSTTDSLSAAQGKILNETKAVNKTLTNEDLNTVTTPGFYNAGGGNSVTNKPSGVNHFGLIVVHNASGAYYTQNIFNDSSEWKRTCTNGTWSSWINVTVQTAVPANAKFTDTVYTHPTSSGNKHIPSGGSAGQILRWSADGTAVWGADNNTMYSVATTSANGLMSKDDKVKLDGITASADTVSFSRSLTSGTKVGTITINGTGTDLYAPTNTDTHWTTGITAGETETTSNSATTNGNTFIKIKDNSTHRGQIKLVGSGATSVSSDANGVITISSTDNNTTYGSMSVSEGTTGTATTNRVLTAANLKGIINAHAPTKTGSGASGTWGISISGNAATASKVNNKLTVGSKSYDGSAAVTIAASDLGLASAMLFLGTTTTAIKDGATTNPVAISGSNKTVTAGNVVLYGSKEFVWTGSAWEELGNEGSYKIVQAAVADPSASGTSNTFIATISQDTNGKITATKKTVAVTNSAPTLAWNTTSTIGTVAGTNLQVKMPANPNTDTKVTQTAINATDYTNWRPLIWGSSNSGTEGFTPSTITDGVYTAQTLSCQPSSGTIRATTFKGNLSGNAATATKLTTARTIRTNLASTSTASFDGSANITPGVTGTLPIANGGTGATTASAARDNLGAQSKVLYGNSAPSDSIGSDGDMYVALESDDIKKDIVDLIYPVGSIYISMNSTDPSTLFGGTWEAFGQGRVLIGAGTGNDGSTSLSFTAGSIGGEYKHSLTTSEMPSHTHSFSASGSGTTAANNRGHTHTYVKAIEVQGHTLTIEEIPSHGHGYKLAYGGNDPVKGFNYGNTYAGTFNDSDQFIQNNGGGKSHSHNLSTSSVASGGESQNHIHTFSYSISGTTGSAGSGSSHNNIQPYIVVYMWKRTA